MFANIISKYPVIFHDFVLVCRRKVDLTFVVDHSNSVGPANFEVMKQFIGRTMEHFKIGPDQTRVSVVCFGTQANVEWTFNDYPGQNMKAANDALKQIRFTGGASRLDLAFDLANEGIYNEKNGMRKFAFKVIVAHLKVLLMLFLTVSFATAYSSGLYYTRTAPKGNCIHRRVKCQAQRAIALGITKKIRLLYKILKLFPILR